MTLSAGTRLGPYEILAPLGAGGMGEVYRARDTRLGRDVALKVLPEAVASDRERLGRFEQEARAASALNHPNIVTIHDIGQHDSTSYIAMEFVDGKSLRELLVAGPLALRKLLDIAAQVADGLAKAHAAGIIHRDLKPENLMVSKDGFVKILDFGLAKLAGLEGEDLSKMPTVAKPETHPGTVLGTVGYMSPEQASGQPLDFRSDQFSLGSILYEMATGQKAFARKTAVDTLAAILHDEPEPIGQLNPRVPAPLRWITERCLAKDAEERYASTRDLARDLESVRDHLSEATVSGEALGVAAPRRRALARAVLAAAALLAALAAGLLLGRRGARIEPPSFHQITSSRGTIRSARFAPDGQTIVFSAAWDGNPLKLFLKHPESPDSLPLALPNANLLAISASGEMAISLDCGITHFGVCSGTLARAALTGGAPREILEGVQQADSASDGESLVVVRDVANTARLEFPIGKVLYETAGHISHPRLSPKGDWIAFFDHPLPLDDRGSLAVVDLAGKKRTLSGGWETEQGLAWSPSGDEIWFTAARAGGSRSLYGVRLSGRQRVIVRVAGGLTLHDISRTGRVLLARDTTRFGMLGLAPGETRERNLSWLDWSIAQDLSADGKTLLFEEESEPAGTNYAVCLRKTDGSPVVRLGEGSALSLSPDGRWALTRLPHPAAPFVLLPTGPGQPKALKRGEMSYSYSAVWSPDGKRILFAGSEAGRGTRLYVQALDGGKSRPISPEGMAVGYFSGVAISPDGKFVAAVGPGRKAALFPVDGGEPRPIPGIADEEVPLRWSGDGRSLYVSKFRELPARVFRIDLDTGRRVLWKELMPADPAGLDVINRIVLTPDGRSYVYTYSRTLSDLYFVEGLK